MLCAQLPMNMPGEESCPSQSPVESHENMLDRPARRFRNSRGRSRYGCLACKSRRVKCDETRPKCSLCTRHGNSCKYGAQPPPPEWERNVHTFNSLSRDSTPSEFSGAGSDPSLPSKRQSVNSEIEPPGERPGVVVQEPMHVSPFCTIQDSQLLRHFKSTTSKTLLPFYQGQLLVWEQEVIQLAFNNDFLMHAVLMTSALHLYCTNGSEAYWFQSIYHLQHTLTGFNSVLQQPTVIETNPDAVLATSILLIVHMGGTPPSFQPCCNPITFLIKGTHDIIQHTQQCPSGIFRRLYTKSCVTLPVPECRPALDLVRMVKPISIAQSISLPPSSPMDDANEHEKADAYCLRAIKCISDILHAADTGRPFAPGKMVETILQRMCPPYLALIEARHSKALVIMAYYHGALAVSLAHHSSLSAASGSGCASFWWLEQMPGFHVRAIAAALGPDWGEWMRWPMEAVERGRHDGC